MGKSIEEEKATRTKNYLNLDSKLNENHMNILNKIDIEKENRKKEFDLIQKELVI